MKAGEPQWARAFADADVVIVGPAPPLRGGIALHTQRLGEAMGAAGYAVAAASFRRLYPATLFPGRSQRTPASAPPAMRCSHELLDVLSPPTWLALGRALEHSRATVVLEWWHPVAAPAYAVATRRLARERLVAVCHNATPHEPFPAAAAAARLVLSRCDRVVCHSGAEADRVRGLLGQSATSVVSVPLPCLLGDEVLEGSRPRRLPPELADLAAGTRIFVAAGHVRPYKAVDVLLRAWGRARRPPEARLVIVGESYLGGASRREVADLAGLDPSIMIVDRYVEDAELVEILASAEVLVAAHRSASQSGLVPIARELGLPCIVSDAGGLAGQMAQDEGAGGARGQVVRAGEEESLCVAIEGRLAAPPARRSTRGEAGDGSAARRAGEWNRVVEAISIAARPTARP